ncbi:PRTase-like protein [Pyrenochaeta sp. DS3sAY3a]|nr:PRTase-like protein [Pyrenochaeta sp. DS3sAY3a]
MSFTTTELLKPARLAAIDKERTQCSILQENNQLLSSMTILRDKTTSDVDFARVFRRVAAQLMTEALNFVPTETSDIITPTGAKFSGKKQTKKVCGVSILRAGASLEQALREAYEGPCSFGKILIQRDEETCKPVCLYSKLPASITQSTVLILEPMLATGGSIMKAVGIILERGVLEEDIVIVSVLASRQALGIIGETYPRLVIVVAAVDENLTSKKYIEPGLGDFGDRYYGTN